MLLALKFSCESRSLINGRKVQMRKNSAASAADGFVRSTMPVLYRNSAGKRNGPVEDVIAWAWREELPKVPKRSGPQQMMPGWLKNDRFAELLSLVDQLGVNEYGAVPDFSADSWPCVDARIIARAVMDLDACDLELPEDWRPAPELDGFPGLGSKAVSDAWRRMTVDKGDGRQVLRLRPSDLIVHRAIMGFDANAMRIDGVEQRFEAWGNGEAKWFVRRPTHVIIGKDERGGDLTRLENVEVNGWNSKSRRPMPGAYRKPYLDPDPVDAVIARAEHEIWLSALVAVYDAVAHELEDIVMLPSRVPVSPWLGDSHSRVLPDLLAQAAMQREEQARNEALFAKRFPRWFKALRKASENIPIAPA